MSDLIKLGEENELFSFNDDITYNTNQKQDWSLTISQLAIHFEWRLDKALNLGM